MAIGMQQQEAPSVTILLTTYRRAQSLRMTLESMVAMERGGIALAIVVIENGDSHQGAQIVEQFSHLLPLSYLHSPIAGKSAALNWALDTVSLGELVVITDDDVTPAWDWLVQLVDSVQRNGDYAIFGGRNRVIWPLATPPQWALNPAIRGWAFGYNGDIGTQEVPYPRGRYPVGFNFALRRGVIEAGYRFYEWIGPQPKTLIMGSETSFLMKLERDGYKMLYVPAALMGHRVQPHLLTHRGVLAKAASIGRTAVNLRPVNRPRLLLASPALWRGVRIARWGGHAVAFALGWCLPLQGERIRTTVKAMRGIAYNQEALRLCEQLRTANRWPPLD
jgi:cellulose synthase/poly-beta-1,6-N-acetylglucosamine synthase-like glycosyltransferase